MTDPYPAYCLDAAVAHWGRTIEAELDGVEGRTAADTAQKRERVLSRFFGEENKPGQFADPRAMAKVGG